MYLQSDKKSAIKEIQKYLYILSDRKYIQIPRVPIDGIFDKETEGAVYKFQEIKNLTPSGTVDYKTFTELYLDYLDAIKNDYANDYIYGFGSLPLKENDQNEDVKAMHIMINALRKVYPQITEVGSGSYFTKRSGDAIENLREIFLMKK